MKKWLRRFWIWGRLSRADKWIELDAAWTMWRFTLRVPGGEAARLLASPLAAQPPGSVEILCPVVLQRWLTPLRRWQQLLDASCLAASLAARDFLARRGVKVELRLGAKPSSGRGADDFAHCWLEQEGRVIFGDIPDLNSYARLTRDQERRMVQSGR